MLIAARALRRSQCSFATGLVPMRAAESPTDDHARSRPSSSGFPVERHRLDAGHLALEEDERDVRSPSVFQSGWMKTCATG